MQHIPDEPLLFEGCGIKKNKRGKNKGNFQRPNRPYQVWWYRPLVTPLGTQEDLSVSSRLTRATLYIHVSRQSKTR